MLEMLASFVKQNEKWLCTWPVCFAFICLIFAILYVTAGPDIANTAFLLLIVGAITLDVGIDIYLKHKDD